MEAKKRPKITIETCQEKAAERGGKCLSDIYKNNSELLEWECKFLHKWQRGWNVIQRGHWCPHCSGNAKGSLVETQTYAKSKGGECLSTKYKNSKTAMKWRCSKGHTWDVCWNTMKNDRSWCPKCAFNAKMLPEDFEAICIERGGGCDIASFVDASTRINIWCAEGHEWKGVPTNVKHGDWCLNCSGRQRDTIENMRVIARSRGGECLSTVYLNQEGHLRWRCA